MPDNISDRIKDLAITHGINWERVKTKIFNDKIMPVLFRMEADIAKKIENTDITAATRATTRVKRILGLKKTVSKLIEDRLIDANDELSNQLVIAGKNQSLIAIDQLTIALGADADFFPLSAQEIRRVANGSIMPDRVTKTQWFKQLTGTSKRKITGAIEQGFLQGETVTQVRNRILGTGAFGAASGITRSIRRQAEAITRTSLQSLSNEVRTETYQKNKDVIKAIQWDSTLDSRTTEICVGLHGLSWTIGEEGEYIPDGHGVTYPGPTAHWNCRSTTIPVTKSWEELLGRDVETKEGSKASIRSVFERNLKAEGFTPDQIKGAVQNAKASMDGQVARDITFDKWLKGKGEKFTSKMLGKGKAELFFQGKITTRDLINSSAQPLSLGELRKLYDKPLPKLPKTPKAPGKSTPTPKLDKGAVWQEKKSKVDSILGESKDKLSQLDAKITENQALRERMTGEIIRKRKGLSQDEMYANPAIVKLIEKRNSVYKETVGMMKERQVMQEGLDIKIRNTLEQPVGKRGSYIKTKTGEILHSGNIPEKTLKRARQAQEIIESLFAPSLVKKMRLTRLRVNNEYRASYSGGFNSVYIHKDTPLTTIVHEYAHAAESKVGGMKAKTNAFLKKRAGGKEPVSLKKLFPNSGYDAAEIVYEDEWVKKGGNVYTGKIYNDKATEIISMGIERFIQSPSQFYREDPEYFEFLIRVIQDL